MSRRWMVSHKRGDTVLSELYTYSIVQETIISIARAQWCIGQSLSLCTDDRLTDSTHWLALATGVY